MNNSTTESRSEPPIRPSLSSAETDLYNPADPVASVGTLPMPVATWVLRGPTFIVELADAPQLALYGRTTAELVGKPIFGSIPQLSGSGFEELLMSVLATGEPVQFTEIAIILPTAPDLTRTAYFNATIQPLRDTPIGGKPGTIGRLMVIANEVTGIVMARQVVDNQAKQLQALFDQAPVGIAIIGPGPDLVYELANPFYCQLVGRTETQLVGQSFFTAFPEVIGLGFDALLLGVLATGERYVSRETSVSILRNGRPETIHVDFVYNPRRAANGTITGVLIVVTDIGPAVLARQQREANERMLNAMVRQSPLGVAIFSGPDFVIELANPTVCQIWGRRAEQVVGKPLFEALPEAADQGFEELLTGVLQTGIAYTGRELPATLRRNGQLDTVYFDLVYEPLLEADGRVERIMVVATDSTVLRQTRQTLERSEIRYRELSEELDRRVNLRTQDLERSNLDLMQFASVASHDLKEPLRKVQTFGTRLETMLAGRLTDEETDMFRRLINATNRMSTLVGDVLRLSILSDQTANFEPVPLEAVIDQIREDLELLLHDRQAAVTNEPLPVVSAMPGQMHQLFQNLISNAIKFNTDPAPVIHIHQLPLTDEMTRTFVLPSPHYAVIAVTDNGIGFDQKYADKIFGMFQRLHGRSKYEGTGIGLTIVKKIIDNHRGFIDVHSESGQGTTFRIVLPRMQ